MRLLTAIKARKTRGAASSVTLNYGSPNFCDRRRTLKLRFSEVMTPKEYVPDCNSRSKGTSKKCRLASVIIHIARNCVAGAVRWQQPPPETTPFVCIFGTCNTLHRNFGNDTGVRTRTPIQPCYFENGQTLRYFGHGKNSFSTNFWHRLAEPLWQFPPNYWCNIPLWSVAYIPFIAQILPRLGNIRNVL